MHPTISIRTTFGGSLCVCVLVRVRVCISMIAFRVCVTPAIHLVLLFVDESIHKNNNRRNNNGSNQSTIAATSTAFAYCGESKRREKEWRHADEFNSFRSTISVYAVYVRTYLLC